MLQLRKSMERGKANHGWLKSQHTFSFADYYDHEHMGFSVLRVINEDFIDAGTGFGTHPHRDMEIITYVVSGALEHKDSMGNSAVIKPGEMQRMSAGTGVRHSEHSQEKSVQTEPQTHLLQIWIMPEKMAVEPSYAQKDFQSEINKGGLVLTVSRDGAQGSLTMNQDARLYVAKPKAESTLTLTLEKTRKGWLQVIEGSLVIGEKTLQAGDALAFVGEKDPEVTAKSQAHFLFFDLPA
jgi:redox-sensitive bicupin YhaK (pirin superfamily)